MTLHPLRTGSWWSKNRSALPRNQPRPLLYRLVPAASPHLAPQGDLARDPHLALVEAALLAADEPLTPRRLAAVAGIADVAQVRGLVERLRALYDRDGTAFQVEDLAGGYQLRTRPDYHPWLARLRRAGGELKLTPAARETLAIVAYRQPITRADVEAVRGVNSSELLHQLMEKGLVRIAGRDDSLGRPVLYATTRKFLQLFGLNSLRDLPEVPDLAAPRQRRGPASEETEPGGS